VGDQYAEDVSYLLRVMGSGVVEECVAVAFGVFAEVVGVFLLLLAWESFKRSELTYLGNGDGVLRESQVMAQVCYLVYAC
jgi:hypothetical protein